jgi:hypothetical protein
MYTITRHCIVISIITTLCINASVYIDHTGSQYNNPWVYDVPQAFLNIPVKTHIFLNIWANNVIKPPRYTQTLANRYEGIWGGLNHFQSIKRMPAHLGMGNFVAILGTDPHMPESQLFIAKLTSQENNEFFKKNTTSKNPPATDKFIKKISLSTDYWHVGSMDMAGSYLAIPMYKNEGSQIAFYEVTKSYTSDTIQEDLNIKDLEIAIERSNMNATAAALTRLLDGYYLLAVWTDGLNDKSKGLDFYCSKDTNITNGFDKQHMIHIPTKLFNNYKGNNNFQNINFVNDDNGNLYLIALENAAPRFPLHSNEDKAYLFEIKVRTTTHKTIKDAKKYDPQGITAQLTAGTKRPYVLYMMEKHMFCKQGSCSFDSGATIYIPDQQHIFLYSIPPCLIDHGNQLTIAQYGSLQKTYPVR